MKLSDWIQTAAVLAAVAAAIVALVISWLDRKNARDIAAADRRTALEHQKLMFDLQLLQRLTQNLNRGGHTDQVKIHDMGAEAQSIIGLIGPNLLPRNWENRIAKSEDELRDFVADDTKADWLRNAVEAELAVIEVSKRIDRELNS